MTRHLLRMLLATIAALQWLLPPALAADHRDAPTVDSYSAADITDIFLFHDPADKTKLVIVMDTQPLSGPTFADTYHFQPNALYRFYFSNTPNTVARGIPDANIDFIFSPFQNGSQTFKATFPHGIVVNGTVTLGSVTGAQMTPIINGPDKNGITVFAGPREDPFVFDRDGYARVLAKTGGFTGTNAFRGGNTSSIVAEFPISLVAGYATKFAAWGVTYVGDLSTYDGEHFDPSAAGLQQIDQMGNPNVNAFLIPAALKDAFNFTLPQDDQTDFAPVIVNTLKNFGTNATTMATLLSIVVPDTLKLDTTKPDGFPNGRRLQDRPVDFTLSLILNTPTTDGTGPEQAARHYGTTFPYLEPPLAQYCLVAPPAPCSS